MASLLNHALPAWLTIPKVLFKIAAKYHLNPTNPTWQTRSWIIATNSNGRLLQWNPQLLSKVSNCFRTSWSLLTQSLYNQIRGSNQSPSQEGKTSSMNPKVWSDHDQTRKYMYLEMVKHEHGPNDWKWSEKWPIHNLAQTYRQPKAAQL